MSEATPKAKPIPRDYKIHRTIHAEKRAFSPRDIPLETIDDTVRTGRAHATGEIGRRGGHIFEFSKTSTVRAGRHMRSKSVVVIAEIMGDTCRVITTFNEHPRV